MQLSVCTVNNSLTCIHCSHDEALTVEEKRTYHHDYFPIPKVISLEYHAAIFLSIFSVNNSLTCMGRLHFNHSDLSMSENEVVNMFFFQTLDCGISFRIELQITLVSAKIDWHRHIACVLLSWWTLPQKRDYIHKVLFNYMYLQLFI